MSQCLSVVVLNVVVPVSRGNECRGTCCQLRHFSPQAFRFFMEQHVENVLSMFTQRLQRRAQLEAEMSQCQLPAATQTQIRKMLAQKESNYLRLRRAKMDRLDL